MPSHRKLFIHNTLVEVTFRAEEGLPLTANFLVIYILHSIFARAQSFHPVTLCHFLIMANHVHLHLVVKDPAQVPKFVEYIKRESSHAINRLLGRKKRTIWAAGYDSPTILDAQKAMERIVYLYTNPQKADLVDKIEQYPHFSSWGAFASGKNQILTVKRITRDSIKSLPGRTLALKELKSIALGLTAHNRDDELTDDREYELIIEPNAWMKCFNETRSQDPAIVNARILRMIRAKELNYRKSRTAPVLGAAALELQSMRKAHEPKKRGKRMLCFSSFKELRAAFINWYRGHCALITSAYDPPPGIFRPGGVLLASLVPWILPTANTFLMY